MSKSFRDVKVFINDILETIDSIPPNPVFILSINIRRQLS